jgi:hypothetical protein
VKPKLARGGKHSGERSLLNFTRNSDDNLLIDAKSLSRGKD